MSPQQPDTDLSPEEAERLAGEVARRLLNTPPQPRKAPKRDADAPKRPRGRLPKREDGPMVP